MTNRPTRRYLIPTWLLVLIALAGFLGLLLTDPVPAVGATLEDFPPPLPLDPLPTATPDPALAAWLTLAGVVLGAAALLYAYLELCTDVLADLRARRRQRV